MARIIVGAVVGSVLAVLCTVGVMKIFGLEISSAVVAAIGGAVGAVSGASAASRVAAEEDEPSDEAAD
ncbi:MAG: hypothetical protein ED559_02640 [Phycisphaera sp.]|nr:MAG: hypothetical protein ED559_02640 [Phycisphaera sp.]